ncbi:MAG: hypothetical protein GAK43_02559 [Stenotrophomonas maltophilia]|nr:MAG: hypothetical protein GAK43_02559 [Stenotrophomonas maltophilia]
MSRSSPALRRALINWLYFVALLHLLAGLVLVWGGRYGLLDSYVASLDGAFWSVPAPAAAREQHLWWLALFGATLQCYAVLLALVQLGQRLRRPAPWAWIAAGLLLWAPQDMWISSQREVWSHLAVDLAALLALLPPLLWLYRHDRRPTEGVST